MSARSAVRGIAAIPLLSPTSRPVEQLKVLETERLVLRWLRTEDAAFILRLVNEPSWLRYIGDYGVRTLQDAQGYIAKGPVAMYARLGFGLYLVELKSTGGPIGICGLIKREALPEVDLGFAFLQEFRGQGYAFESASATLAYGRRSFRLSRIVAVSSPENNPAATLLEKLGFRFEHMARLAAGAPEVKLYAASP
jgi:ribosomal-protein-alanine N-acetyltransferase